MEGDRNEARFKMAQSLNRALALRRQRRNEAMEQQRLAQEYEEREKAKIFEAQKRLMRQYQYYLERRKLYEKIQRQKEFERVGAEAARRARKCRYRSELYHYLQCGSAAQPVVYRALHAKKAAYKRDFYKYPVGAGIDGGTIVYQNETALGARSIQERHEAPKYRYQQWKPQYDDYASHNPQQINNSDNPSNLEATKEQYIALYATRSNILAPRLRASWSAVTSDQPRLSCEGSGAPVQESTYQICSVYQKRTRLGSYPDYPTLPATMRPVQSGANVYINSARLSHTLPGIYQNQGSHRSRNYSIEPTRSPFVKNSSNLIADASNGNIAPLSSSYCSSIKEQSAPSQEAPKGGAAVYREKAPQQASAKTGLFYGSLDRYLAKSGKYTYNRLASNKQSFGKKALLSEAVMLYKQQQYLLQMRQRLANMQLEKYRKIEYLMRQQENQTKQYLDKMCNLVDKYRAKSITATDFQKNQMKERLRQEIEMQARKTQKAISTLK